MSDTVKMEGFEFGGGAFNEEGAKFKFEMNNCTATYRIRALDGVRKNKLKEQGIDINLFTPPVEILNIISAESANDDMTAEKIDAIKKLEEWGDGQTELFSNFCEAMILGFSDLKRSDGTTVECNKETIRGHGGYPPFIKALRKACEKAAAAQIKNSKSLSDGKSATPETAGEPTSETADATE